MLPQVPSEEIARIKACAPLMRALRTLKEGNLEFMTVDSRTVITDHPLAAVGAAPGAGLLFGCESDYID